MILRAVAVFVGVIFAGVLIVSVVNYDYVDTAASDDVTDASQTIGIENKIHDLVNEKRRDNGLPELVFDARLADIAQAYAKEINESGVYSHVDQHGNTLIERYSQAGYTCQIKISHIENVYGGENLNRINGYFGQDASTKIVDSWYDSADHRSNMLSPYFTKHGIGVDTSNLVLVVVENFC